jgi:hypothetical protein
MTRAEGFFFVSGKQHEGIVLVPAAATYEGTMLVAKEQPLASHVQQAVTTPGRASHAVDVAQIGPEEGRLAAKAVLRSKDQKNVALSEASLVYVPVALAMVSGRKGQRTLAVGPMGQLPLDAAVAMARAQALTAAARSADRSRLGSASGS